MQFLSIGGRAEGVIAIGQEAVGIFALGQFATGVIAIGQVARGVVAIGQVSLGFVAIGQLALGLSFGAAMLGAGGRALGIVLPLVPVPRRKKKLPPITSLSEIRLRGEGSVIGTLKRGAGSQISLEADGERIPLVVHSDLFLAAYHYAKTRSQSALVVRLKREGQALALMQMDEAPAPVVGLSALVSAAQLALLLIAAGVFMQFCGVDLANFLIRSMNDIRANGVSFG